MHFARKRIICWLNVLMLNFYLVWWCESFRSNWQHRGLTCILLWVCSSVLDWHQSGSGLDSVSYCLWSSSWLSDLTRSRYTPVLVMAWSRLMRPRRQHCCELTSLYWILKILKSARLPSSCLWLYFLNSGCPRPVCNEPENCLGLTPDNCNEIAISVSIRLQLQSGYSR